MKFIKLLAVLIFYFSLNGYTKVKKLECAAVFLPNNPIVLEAGACRGGDTQRMAQLWKKGTVHAFEPIACHFETLIKNTERFSNVFCYPYGLGSAVGSFSFYISERDGIVMDSSSLLAPKEHLEWCKDILFPKVVQIKTLTLDSWAQENNINNIDFMWLDLQGSELDVLRASTKILKTVKVIWTEATYKEIYKGGARYPQLKKFLENEGFTFVCISGGVGFMFDALFVRNEVYTRVTSEINWPALFKRLSRQSR